MSASLADDHGPYVEHNGVRLYPIRLSSAAWATRDGWLVSYGVNTYLEDPPLHHTWWVIDPSGRPIREGFASMTQCAQRIKAAS